MLRMTFNVGHYYPLSVKEPDVRVSSAWEVGTSVLFAQVNDDVKIFRPKFLLAK